MEDLLCFWSELAGLVHGDEALFLNLGVADADEVSWIRAWHGVEHD